MRWGFAVLLMTVLVCGGAAWGVDESRLPAQQQMMRWVRDLCRTAHRRPGTSEGHRAERYVADQFRRIGLQQVRVEPVAIEVWQPRRWGLTVSAAGRRHDLPCFYVPYTKFTPQQGIEGPLVYLGDGAPEAIAAADLRGKIAVFDLRFGRLPIDALKAVAHYVQDSRATFAPGEWQPGAWERPNWQAYDLAAQAGAAGVIWILADQPTNTNTYYAPYDGVMKPVPGLYVGKHDGVELRRLCQSRAMGRLVLEGRCEPGLMCNIVGILPGPGARTIAVTSHHDAPFVGATEDGTGMAALLALASYYAALPEAQRPASMVFAATAGHFYGGRGMDALIEEHRADLLRDVAFAVVVEHVGAREFVERDRVWAPTGRLQSRALFVWPQLVPAAVAAVKDEGLERTVVVPPDILGGAPPGEAAGFHNAAIPCVQYTSGPLYLLFGDDTLDKVEPGALLPVVRMIIRLIENAAQAAGG